MYGEYRRTTVYTKYGILIDIYKCFNEYMTLIYSKNILPFVFCINTVFKR